MVIPKNIHFFRHNPHMVDISIRYYIKKKSKQDLLKVGVVGCGGGGLMHISHYLWHKETIVSTVFDINSDRFNDIKKRFPFADNDIHTTTNFEDILNNKEIEIVSIASPDHTHAEYAIAALEAGKHVLCEKPMCTSIIDAKKIIKVTKKTKGVFAVFQQMRFVPRNKIVHSMIEKNELGEIFFISTGYIHDMRKRAFEFSQWRKDPMNHQHPLFGGIHHIDLLRWMAGEVEEVYTIATHKGFYQLPIDDTYITQLKLKNGGIGSILTCFSPRVPQEYHPLRIYGSKGSVHGNRIYLEKNENITEKTLKKSDYKGTPQFREQISAFIDSVMGRKSNIVTAKDGGQTVAVCNAAIESWKSGKPTIVQSL